MGQVRKIKAGLVVNSSASDFVGEIGNIFFDISDGVLRLSDGSTPGGVPLTSGGAEGGASTFRQLLDTPNSFTGSGGYFVKVNQQASALEFVNVSLFDGNYNSLTNKPTLFDPADVTQTLTPRTDIAIDLGTATKRWRDLYLSGNTIYLGDTTISRNASGGVDLPANSKINGKKIAEDLKDLTDNEGLLSNRTTSYNDLTNKPDLSVYQLASTAFSGSYNDLTNKPVLFDGAYSSLTGKPTIPTDISQLTDNNNILASSGAGYSLPKATNSVLGGIKIGSGLAIDADGVVSVTISSGVTSYTQLTDLPTLFSGSYDDLTNKPTLVTSYTQLTDKPTLVTSYTQLTDLPTLFSGSYNDLTNKPTLVTSYTQLTDLPTLFSGSYNDLTNLPVLVTSYTQLTDLPTLFSGSYNDLTNKPVIPADTGDLTNNAGFITISSLTGYATETFVTSQGYLTTVSYNDLTDLPTLFSGSYEDLTNRPTLVTSYTQLTDLPTLFSGSYDDLTNKPIIPADISDLTDVNNRLASNITQDDLFVYSLIF